MAVGKHEECLHDAGMSDPVRTEQTDTPFLPEGCTLDGETGIRVSAVPAILSKMNGGKRVSRSTVHRWLTAGIQGIRLEGVRVGGTWYTSIEALRRFLTATTQAATSGTSDSPTVARSTSCTPTHHTAMRKLAARGMRV